MAKFHKTTITVTVLSEEPVPTDLSLQEIAREGHVGAYVLTYDFTKAEQLSEDEIVEALEEAGSDASFFEL